MTLDQRIRHANQTTQQTAVSATQQHAITAPVPVVTNERRYDPEQAADILTRLEMRKEEERRKTIRKQAEKDLRYVTKEEEDDRIPQSRLYTILEERGFEREAIEDIIATHYPSAQQQRQFFAEAGVIPTANRFLEEGIDMYKDTFLRALQEAYPDEEFVSASKITRDPFLGQYHAHLKIEHKKRRIASPTRNPVVKLWHALQYKTQTPTPVLTITFDDVFNYNDGKVWGNVHTYLQSPKTIVLEDRFDGLEKTLKRASKAGGSLFNVSRQRTYSVG